MIEQNLLVNHELKEEVKSLRKDVICLKDKEKAQPSQDNRENIVKKLERGSNLASSKIQQKNHTSCNAKATKGKKHGKRLCYGCGLYGHEWSMCSHKSWADNVEATKQKASIKVAKQVKSDEPKCLSRMREVGPSYQELPLVQRGKKEGPSYNKKMLWMQ